jgi:hypothetical protein
MINLGGYQSLRIQFPSAIDNRAVSRSQLSYKPVPGKGERV